MEVVSQEIVNRIKEEKKGGEFSKAISSLKKGEALCISLMEWRRRTSIPHYFLSKYNRRQKTVSVLRIGDCYYVIKV